MRLLIQIYAVTHIATRLAKVRNAEWEQKWGIPDEYQTGPSVRLSAVK